MFNIVLVYSDFQNIQDLIEKVSKFNGDIILTKNIERGLGFLNFDNIQTLIKVNKTLTDQKTDKQTFYSEYLIANFRTTAEDFYNRHSAPLYLINFLRPLSILCKPFLLM